MGASLLACPVSDIENILPGSPKIKISSSAIPPIVVNLNLWQFILCMTQFRLQKTLREIFKK